MLVRSSSPLTEAWWCAMAAPLCSTICATPPGGPSAPGVPARRPGAGRRQLKGRVVGSEAGRWEAVCVEVIRREGTGVGGIPLCCWWILCCWWKQGEYIPVCCFVLKVYSVADCHSKIFISVNVSFLLLKDVLYSRMNGYQYEYILMTSWKLPSSCFRRWIMDTEGVFKKGSGPWVRYYLFSGIVDLV